MLKRLSHKTMLAALVLTLCACTNDTPEPIDLNAADVSDDGVNRPLVSIYDTAVAADTFTTLVSALEATGLGAELADETKNYTVFAATDAAFEKLGSDTINAWLGDTEIMRNILEYHIVADKIISSVEAVDMVGSLLDMVNGDNVSVTHDGDNFYINNAKVIVTDVLATNGIIHVIDTVLSPPVNEPTPLNVFEKIDAQGSFKQLNQALISTGLDEKLSNANEMFTLLAPSDEAFAKLSRDRMDLLLSDTELMRNTLLYHVIDGEALNSTTAMSLSGRQKKMSNGDDLAIYLINGQLKVNEANVTRTDLRASNGIIHTIDSVLTPPAHPVSSPSHQQVAIGSILDTTRRTPDYSLFSFAVEFANLEGALGSPIDMYTAFVPTNEAFKALNENTRNHLFSDPHAMRDVILAHVLAGRVMDTATATERIGFDLKAGNGGTLVITQQADTLWVNDAKILKANVTTINGIVHIIDKVILP